MGEAALKYAPQPLRVAVFAADPRRQALLSQLVHDLGHSVSTIKNAAVVLSEGVAINDSRPTVVLGVDGDDYRAKLPGDASAEQVDAALRAVAVGLSVTVAEDAERSFEALPETEPRTLLTPREIEVLNAVASGLTNKEIARALSISQHTVKFHLESLMRKLEVSSRAEAVSKSMRLRLLEPYRL
jgi:DNA-binding NarL/FixJ family response regulator